MVVKGKGPRLPKTVWCVYDTNSAAVPYRLPRNHPATLMTLHNSLNRTIIMSDLSDIVSGDAGWVDSHDSDAEVYSEMSTDLSPEKDSLKRKRSLVLTAVGLSQSDSDGRKRLRTDLVIRRNSFTHLPQDVRNRIYKYMTFPPLEDKHDVANGYCARNLALTCRQAKQEWDEERHRRFWVHLKEIKDLYLADVGDELTYPQELSSKLDLPGVQSLKVIITGQNPIDNGLPEAMLKLLALPLQELAIHFTGASRPLPSYDHAKSFLMEICDVVENILIHPKRFTVSWNYQNERKNVLLSGSTFELKDSDKQRIRQSTDQSNTSRRKTSGTVITAWTKEREIRRMGQKTSGLKTSWPVISVAVSEDMEVGMMRMMVGSAMTNEAALVGLRELSGLFWNTDDTSTDGFERMKTFNIETLYEVGEDA